MRWFWLLGLTLAAWEDLRSREFPYWIWWLWLLPGLLYALETGIWEHLGAAAVGAALLLLSRATRGAIGEGDGLFFLMTACYLDVKETAVLFLAGLGISCVWSMAVLLGAHMGGGRRQDSIPFLTCVWLPGMWLVCRGMPLGG